MLRRKSRVKRLPKHSAREKPQADNGQRLLFYGGLVCGAIGLVLVFNPISLGATTGRVEGRMNRNAGVERVHETDTVPLGVVLIVTALGLVYLGRRVSRL